MEITEEVLAAKSEERRRQATEGRATSTATSSKADDGLSEVIGRLRQKERRARRRCERCGSDDDLRFVKSAELCRPCREEAEREAREAREARIRARLQRFLEQPGAEEHQDSTLDNFDPRPDKAALAAARQLVEHIKDGLTPSLYLYSERAGEPMAPGTGKTHLAVGIARELIAAGKSAAITRVNRLMLEVYRTFKREDSDALDVVDRYTSPDVVVLDDLGTEKWNEYNLSVLYEIISSRAHKVTIITSNYSLTDLDANDPTGYMPRITSRIAGTCKLVRMTGPDRRLRRNKMAA